MLSNDKIVYFLQKIDNNISKNNRLKNFQISQKVSVFCKIELN